MSVDPLNPPAIPTTPYTHQQHGVDRPDPWYWLSDRTNPEVERVLREQDDFTVAAMEPTKDLQERLFQEMKARVQEDDETVPARRGQWHYFRRTQEGSQYEEHWRRNDDGTEQLIFDENEAAGDSDYLDVGVFSISPEQDVLAFGLDLDGSEVFDIKFRNIETKVEHDDLLRGAYYGATWANDNATIYYLKIDAAMRPYQVWRHHMGKPQSEDELIYEENDERFFVHIGKTRSRTYNIISSGSKTTTEAYLLDANDPNAAPTIFSPREQGVIYGIEHHKESNRFFVTSNRDTVNFRLYTTPEDATDSSNWSPLLEADDDIRLEDVDVFSGHAILSERAEANQRLRVLNLSTNELHTIEQDEPVYSVWVGTNLEYETTTLRFGYTSLVTPASVFDYDLENRTRELLKQQPVLGEFKRAHYESRREWATAPDGTQIPISLVFHRDTPLDGSAPLFQYGYGAYEHAIDPSFSLFRLSLLNRGFVYAIAHVRGGGERGRQWYDDGKLDQKMNSFTDFIACTEHLVGEGYGSPGRIAIRGGSAGGALMGAVANLRPELYGVVIAEVPFVDCLTTMLDPSLPLTITEYEEWGNPNERDAFDYIRSYAPVENVTKQDYPAMLITGGYNDPRVSYWEPVKWAARLRENSTSGKPILLKIEMGAGHFGPSGRYDAWREESFTLAFALSQLGIS